MSVSSGIGVRLRTSLGQMTQAEFAERIGVHRKTVERWESGERIPDGESLLALKQEFGVEPGWLLTGDGEAPGVSTLTPDERELLALFRAAPLAVKASAVGALKGGTAPGSPKVSVGGAFHGQVVEGNQVNRGPVSFGNKSKERKK